MIAWLKRQWRRWTDPAAPDDLEPGPAVAAFLAGDSLRKATYFHRESDPALAAAGEWREQIKAMEKAIRAHVGALRERIEELEDELVVAGGEA